jgi:hypothetical protein
VASISPLVSVRAVISVRQGFEAGDCSVTIGEPAPPEANETDPRSQPISDVDACIRNDHPEEHGVMSRGDPPTKDRGRGNPRCDSKAKRDQAPRRQQAKKENAHGTSDENCRNQVAGSQQPGALLDTSDLVKAVAEILAEQSTPRPATEIGGGDRRVETDRTACVDDPLVELVILVLDHLRIE